MMLSNEQRKEAARKFREKKCSIGVYAVNCAASGRVWVGPSRNLESARNSVWFSLRLGAHREPSLQEEWKARGEEAFTFEVLEAVEEDTPALLVPDLLREMKKRWMALSLIHI